MNQKLISTLANHKKTHHKGNSTHQIEGYDLGKDFLQILFLWVELLNLYSFFCY